jgi:hypothetical protein
LRKPQLSWETWTTPTEIVAEVDRLLDHHTYGEIATLLNQPKLRPGRGERFSSRIIARIRTCYALRPRYDRLRQAGMLTVTEMAERLRVNPKTVKVWCAHGLLKGFRYTDKGESRIMRGHPGGEGSFRRLQMLAGALPPHPQDLAPWCLSR